MTGKLTAPATLTRTAGSSEDLFPLALSPFEQFMLLEDRPSHPMQYFSRLRFTGQLDRAGLESAYRSALQRHPLLTAVVRSSARGQFEWIASEHAEPTMEWLDQRPTDEFVSLPYLDIRQSPGLGLTVASDGDRTDLTVLTHHVACDALGAFDFVSDLLTIYARDTAGQPARLKPLEAGRLASRAEYAMAGAKRATMADRQAAATAVWMQRPSPVLPHTAPEAVMAAVPACLVHRFSAAESTAIQQAARRAKTTINNLLARDLFLALDLWRREHGVDWSDRFVRLMVPINMRQPADRRTPAANLVSCALLDRRAAELADAQQLLRTIGRDLSPDQQPGLGQPFMLAVNLVHHFPEKLAAQLRRDECLTSVVLTNLGPALANCSLPRRERKLQLGTATLESVEFLPILRPFHCFNFGLHTYAGTVSLGMHYDRRVVSDPQARQALDLYLACIRRSCHN